MLYWNPEEREARIKELEAFRDVWQTDIEKNANEQKRLVNLKAMGLNAETFDRAIERTIVVGENLASAKANIEGTIERVRSGGY